MELELVLVLDLVGSIKNGGLQMQVEVNLWVGWPVKYLELELKKYHILNQQ